MTTPDNGANDKDYVTLPLHKFVELRSALEKVADLHHRCLTPSRKHDPERQIDFRACECLTCKSAATALYYCVPDDWMTP